MSQANASNTPSRRALLAGVPAVAGAALAGAAGVNIAAIAVTTGPDPIFAAIGRERRAHSGYRRARQIERELNLRNPGKAHREAKAEEWRAWFAELRQAENVGGEEWWEAQEEFLRTQPTTPAGLNAYLDHIEVAVDPDEGWDDDWAELAFPTLVAAVRALLEGGAA
jgi:hypothetical protein